MEATKWADEHHLSVLDFCVFSSGSMWETGTFWAFFSRVESLFAEVRSADLHQKHVAASVDPHHDGPGAMESTGSFGKLPVGRLKMVADMKVWPGE